jgi:type II secretory ATPase GspE/PulE/Tfp pilus assembly ATPase PilB-like protein
MLGIPPERTMVEVFRGAGCARCGRSGYFDRVGIYEFVPFDAGLTDMVMEKASTESMQQYAVDHGAVTLRADAIAKVLHGWTTLEEAMRVTTADTFGS